MKNRKIYLCALIVLFVLVIIALLFIAFSIKDIKTDYKVAERNADIEKIEERIRNLKGKNLVFFNQNDLDKIMIDFPYFEVESIDKSFPSLLNLTIKERRQIYTVKTENKFAVLDANGIVLDILETKKDGLIEINLENKNSQDSGQDKFGNTICIEQCEVGKKLATNFDDYFYKSVGIVSSVDSNDIFDGMKVVISTLNTFDIVLSTKTKINIVLKESNDSGAEKMDCAMDKYKREEYDFKKSNEMYNMIVLKDYNNKIQIQYSLEI